VTLVSNDQGRRKLLKVGGGAGFEGHFPNKKGHLKCFSRKSWRRKNNINSSFQKCPLGKKRQSFRHFSRKKRALCSRKKGTCQNLGGLPPPPCLPPCSRQQVFFLFRFALSFNLFSQPAFVVNGVSCSFVSFNFGDFTR
jgi:hypothetical protein